MPAFAATLSERHKPIDWKDVLMRTAEMMHSLAGNSALKTDDYHLIHTPCLLLLGDHDKMVTLEEITAVYKSLSHTAMGMLPGMPHPIEQVDMSMLGYTIKRFLTS